MKRKTAIIGIIVGVLFLVGWMFNIMAILMILLGIGAFITGMSWLVVHIVKNWEDQSGAAGTPTVEGHKTKLKKWWQGYTKTNMAKDKPITEKIPGRKDEVKKRLVPIVSKALILFFAPLIFVYLTDILGNFVFSIILGIITTVMIIVISQKVTFKNPRWGLAGGTAVAVLNILLPQTFSGPLLFAAWLIATLGTVTYLIEEFVSYEKAEVNAFPAFMLHVCTVFILVNLVQMAAVGVRGHNVFVSQLRFEPRAQLLYQQYEAQDKIGKTIGISNHKTVSIGAGRTFGIAKAPQTGGVLKAMRNFFFAFLKLAVAEHPYLQHTWAETNRFAATSNQFMDVWQWLLTYILILLVTLPTELRQRWEAHQRDEKGKRKGTEDGDFTAKFIVLDTLAELFWSVMHKVGRRVPEGVKK